MAFSRYFDNSQLAEAIRIANGQTKGVSHINKFGFGGATTNSYTVWDGDNDYVYPSAATTKKDNDTLITLKARPFGGTFNTKGKFASTGDPVHYDYHVPIKFEEKTDIEIKAENQAASGSISALFDLILVDDF